MLTEVRTGGTTEEPEAAGAEGRTETEPVRGAGAETPGADLKTAAEEETGTEGGDGIFEEGKVKNNT
jgi:hypothetical protein